jgi:YD repeat-containing protein
MARSCSVLSRFFGFFLAGTALLFVPGGQCQVLSIGDDTSTPTEGAGHDYIKMLSETVNPANGSVSLRIQAPVPKGRGMTIPFSFNYDSNGINHLVAGLYGTNSCCGILPWDEWLSSNDYLSQSGWSYGVPLAGASFFHLTCPSGLSESDTSNYVFQDPSGGRHSLSLASNDDQCGNPIYATGGDSRYYGLLAGECSGCHVYNPPLIVSDADGNTFYFSTPLAHGDSGITVHGSSLPNSIEDRNGNEATVYDAGLHGGAVGAFTITDSVGRTAISSNGFGPSGATNTLIFSGSMYKIAWETVPAAAYSVSAIPVNVENGVTCAAVPNTVSGSETVVSSITLPNNKSYNFSYNSWGLLSEIDYPTGGWVKYSWKMADQPSDIIVFDGYYYNSTTKLYTYYPNACQYHYKVPVVGTRTVGFGGSSTAILTQTFTYGTQWDKAETLWDTKSTIAVTTDAVMNNSFQTTYNYAYTEIGSMPAPYGNGWPSQIPVESSIQYYNWGNTSSPTRTVSKTWLDVYDIASEQTVLNDDNNLTSQTTYSYQFAGSTETGSVLSQLIQKNDYDYGMTLLRKTGTNYQTFSTTPLGGVIADKPCQTIVYDGSNNSYAETDYYYDNSNSPVTTVCGQAGTPAVSGVSGLVSGTHDETNYGTSSTVPRGNLTNVIKRCIQGSGLCTSGNAVYTYTYDETGQTLSMTDPCGGITCTDMGTSQPSHTTTYAYANSYTVFSSGSNTSYAPSGNTNAYLTKITDPLSHSENFTYDYNNGQLTVLNDENGRNTTYLYNDSMARPTLATYPDGGQIEYAYSDTAPSPSVTMCQLINGTAGATCSSTSPATGWKTGLSSMDGMGHVVQTELVSDPDGATYGVTNYYGTGRPYTVYNPTRCNPPTTNCSTETTWGITTYTYDALGRTTLVAEPDTSKVSTTYYGNCFGSA